MPPAEVIPFATWFTVEEEEDVIVDEYDSDDVFVLGEGEDEMELSDQFIMTLFEASSLEHHLSFENEPDDGMVAIFVEEPGGCYGYQFVPKVIDLTDDELYVN